MSSSLLLLLLSLPLTRTAVGPVYYICLVACKVQESIAGPNLCHLAGCITKAADTGDVWCVREGASAGIIVSNLDAASKCMHEQTSGCEVLDQFLEETGCVGECMEQEGLHSPRQKLCSAATTESDCKLISIPCNDAGSSTPPGV
jgi:hypothetical protein